jgi:hypothetical protein
MSLRPRSLLRRFRAGLLAAALIATGAATASLPAEAAPAACTGGNLALHHQATASSVENSGTPASAAVDGSTATRWSSAFSDPQWLQVDLGASATVCQVVLTWEAAYARAFQVQLSANGTTWSTVYSTTTGTGGTQTLDVAGTGRYVRVLGTARATPYGYSLWELAVRGTGGGGTDPQPDAFWGDTSTIPPAHNVLTVKVLNRTNGRYPDSQVYWNFNGQTHSIAEQPYLDMPANSAGRMYFYLGAPNGQYFDFIEFTVGPDVFNGNTTRVDAFGLKLAMRLRAHDGYDVQVGEDQATFAEDRSVTFQKFVDAVPPQFDVLAQTQAPYRIIAPGSDPSLPARRRERGLLHRLRQLGRRQRADVEHLRLRREHVRQPEHVRRAQPAHRPPAAGTVAGPVEVLLGRTRELLREVLARPRHRQAGLRVPLRRRRGPVLVRLPRRPAVPARRRRVVS